MPIVNYYIDNSETPTPVDVPEGLSKEEQDIWADEFYLPYHDSGLAAAEKDPEHPFAVLPDFMARGFYNLGQGYNTLQETLGFDNPENAAKDIAEFQGYINQIPYDDDVLDTLKAWDEADSIKEYWDIATTPAGLKLIGTVAGESAAQMAPVLGVAAGAVLAGAGSVILGAIGGLGSLGIEYGASIIEAMNEYLAKEGKNATDDKAVAKVLGNAEKMEEFKELALKRGVTIGLIDGLSFGVAGKLTSAVRNATKKAKRFSKLAPIATGAGEALAIQPSLGAFGEFAAQKVAGQETDMGAVIMEGLAEGPTGAIEVGLGVALEGRKQRKIQEAEEETARAIQQEAENAQAYADEQVKIKDLQTKQAEVNKVRSDLTVDINKEQETPQGQRYTDHLFYNLRFNNKPVKKGKVIGNKKQIKEIFNLNDDRSAMEISDYLIKAGYATKKRGKLLFTEKSEQIFNNPETKGVSEVTEEVTEVTEDEKNLNAYLQAQIDETGSLPLTSLEDISNMSLDSFIEDTRKQVEEGRKIRAKTLKLSKNRGNKDFPSYVVTHPNAESYSEGTGDIEISINRSVDDPSSWVVNGMPDIDSAFSKRSDAMAAVKEVLDNYEKVNEDGFTDTIYKTQSEPLKEIDSGPIEERIEEEVETFPTGIEEYVDITAEDVPTFNPVTGELIDISSPVDKTPQLTENVERDFQNIEKIQKEIDRLEALPEQRIAQRNPLSPELEIQREERLDILKGELIETAEQYQQSMSALEDEGFRLRQKPPVKRPSVDETFTDFNIQTEATEFLNFEKPEVIPQPYAEAVIESPSIITELDENGNLVGRLANVAPAQVDRILEAVPDNNPKKEKYKEFKLDIPPPVAPDSEQANVDEILIAQKIDRQVSPVVNNDLDQPYTTEAYQSTMPLATVANHNLVSATSDQEREAIRKNSKEALKDISAAEAIRKAGFLSWSNFHPTRLAEKYPIYGKFYRFIIARRESREQFNNRMMNIVREFYRNTPLETQEKLGQVTAILDGLSGRTNAVIPQQNIRLTPQGGLVITLPSTPPADTMSPERYEAVLEEWGVKPNEVITLSPLEHTRLKQTQKSFREVYKGYARAIMDYNFQKNPIHRSIKIDPTDTLKEYRTKLNTSIQLFINELNDTLPTDQRIDLTADQINKMRTESKRFESIANLLNDKDVKGDEFAVPKVKRILAQLNMIKLLNSIELTLIEHPYYVPRLRFGEFYFTVTDSEGKVIGNHVSNPLTFDSIKDSRILNLGKEREVQKDRLEKRRTKIKEIYKDKSFKVNPIKRATVSEVMDQFNEKHINFLETIASALGYSLNNPTKDNKVESEIVERFIKEIDQRIQEKGFDKYITQRSPELITGYYNEGNKENYLANTLSTYIRTGADTASNLQFYNPINESIKQMKKVDTKAGRTLAQSAEELNTYIHSPNEPGGKLKSFAFLYALGFNVSSATINASQSFTTTIPMLKSIIGFTGPTGRAATAQVVKALNNARKLFRAGGSFNIDSYGFRFDSPTLPKEYSSFLTQDEWTMLRELHGEGVIQAIVNLDLGAKYRAALGESGTLTPFAAQQAERIMDASAYAFGGIEQVNRIAAALAFYRSAKRTGQLKKFERFAEGTVFRDETMTPYIAAKMGVYKTQFLVGKENRMKILRSAMPNVAGQFLSFVLQYSGTMAFALNRWKVDKKVGSILLGNLALGMLVWGGLMGFPFARDADRILRLLSRQVGEEYSIEFGIRQTLRDMDLPSWAEDSIMTGAIGEITGTNLGSRVGVGSVLPSGLLENELTAAGGPALSLAIQSVNKAFIRIGQEDYAGAIAAGLPLGIQNFYEGSQRLLSDEPRDVQTARGQVLLPGENLSLSDNLKSLIGLKPKTISELNYFKSFARFQSSVVAQEKANLVNKLARLVHARNTALSKGDTQRATEKQKEFDEELKKMRVHNQQMADEGRPELIINPSEVSFRNRVSTQLRGQMKDAIKNTSKTARPSVVNEAIRRGLLDK
tara:strand:- start:106 stop:6081 length:5976 start_codon:yes stop_codon:yes gene_type:complete